MFPDANGRAEVFCLLRPVFAVRRHSPPTETNRSSNSHAHRQCRGDTEGGRRAGGVRLRGRRAAAHAPLQAPELNAAVAALCAVCPSVCLLCLSACRSASDPAQGSHPSLDDGQGQSNATLADSMRWPASPAPDERDATPRRAPLPALDRGRSLSLLLDLTDRMRCASAAWLLLAVARRPVQPRGRPSVHVRQGQQAERVVGGERRASGHVQRPPGIRLQLRRQLQQHKTAHGIV